MKDGVVEKVVTLASDDIPSDDGEVKNYDGIRVKIVEAGAENEEVCQLIFHCYLKKQKHK